MQPEMRPLTTSLAMRLQLTTPHHFDFLVWFSVLFQSPSRPFESLSSFPRIPLSSLFLFLHHPQHPPPPSLAHKRRPRPVVSITLSPITLLAVTHSLIHSLLTHLLTHYLTHLPSHSQPLPKYSLIYSHPLTPTHSLTHLLTHSLPSSLTAESATEGRRPWDSNPSRPHCFI